MLYRLSYGSVFAVGGCPVKRGALCQSFPPRSSVFFSPLDPKREAVKMLPMNTPDDTTKKPGPAELRRQRQAQALRANLARRKAQDRARAEEDEAEKASGLQGAETDVTTGG